MELSKIEAALDCNQLWTQNHSGKWYKLRRNGKTKLWKTKPTDFKIPVKWGLRGYTAVEHTDTVLMARELRPGLDFVISRGDPNIYWKKKLSPLEIEMQERT